MSNRGEIEDDTAEPGVWVLTRFGNLRGVFSTHELAHAAVCLRHDEEWDCSDTGCSIWREDADGSFLTPVDIERIALDSDVEIET